jgi:phosphoglycolate phosphatase
MKKTTRLADCRWILLDFDGPVCSAFAGYPAPAIAKHLVAVATEAGVRLADDASDPHEVLRTVNAVSPSAGRSVELALQVAELEAVESATPTLGAQQLLERCAATNRHVAIVSNNHGPAVEKYLHLHGLTAHVDHISGRDPHNVQLMKPNPHLLLEAIRAMGAAPNLTAFVGDSVSDMQAGRAACVIAVGYANKPGKRERLSAAGADIVVAAMDGLASEL